MARSLMFYPNIFLLISIGSFLLSCEIKERSDSLYKASFTSEEKKRYAGQFLDGLGRYYQGSPGESVLKNEIEILFPEMAAFQREKGAVYVKRGFPKETYNYYSKSVKLAPDEWQGNRAYILLYFYRDYDHALKDIETYDSLTPEFVDYPQSTSVDYMRGICYHYKGNHRKSYDYLKKHLVKERQEVGDEYVDIVAFLHLAIVASELGRNEEALDLISLARKNNPSNSDLFFYSALINHKMGNLSTSLDHLHQAEQYFQKGYSINRDYVEEFFQIYQEDIDELRNQIRSSN